MRRGPVIAFLALCACEQEPSFDERFEKADAETRQLAREIDAELKQGEPATDAEVSERQ